MHVVQRLFILERVHTGPKAVVFVGHQLAVLNEPLKRPFHQLRLVVQIVEYFLLENVVAAVDSNIGALNIFDRRDRAAVLTETK